MLLAALVLCSVVVGLHAWRRPLFGSWVLAFSLWALAVFESGFWAANYTPDLLIWSFVLPWLYLFSVATLPIMAASILGRVSGWKISLTSVVLIGSAFWFWRVNREQFPLERLDLLATSVATLFVLRWVLTSGPRQISTISVMVLTMTDVVVAIGGYGDYYSPSGWLSRAATSGGMLIIIMSLHVRDLLWDSSAG